MCLPTQGRSGFLERLAFVMPGSRQPSVEQLGQSQTLLQRSKTGRGMGHGDAGESPYRLCSWAFLGDLCLMEIVQDGGCSLQPKTLESHLKLSICRCLARLDSGMGLSFVSKLAKGQFRAGFW